MGFLIQRIELNNLISALGKKYQDIDTKFVPAEENAEQVFVRVGQRAMLSFHLFDVKESDDLLYAVVSRVGDVDTEIEADISSHMTGPHQTKIRYWVGHIAGLFFRLWEVTKSSHSKKVALEKVLNHFENL